MTIEKWLKSVRNVTVVVVASTLAGAWGFIIAMVIKSVFSLNEKQALSYFAFPLFILIFLWGLVYLPKALRKSGMIDWFGDRKQGWPSGRNSESD